MEHSKAALELPKDHCLDVSIKTLQKWGQLGLPSCAFARGAGLQSHVFGTLVRNLSQFLLVAIRGDVANKLVKSSSKRIWLAKWYPTKMAMLLGCCS